MVNVRTFLYFGQPDMLYIYQYIVMVLGSDNLFELVFTMLIHALSVHILISGIYGFVVIRQNGRDTAENRE